MPKILEGVVTSTKMTGTVVVSVARSVKHPKYHKILKRESRYKARVSGVVQKLGEVIKIKEVRPFSKSVNFIVYGSKKNNPKTS